MEALDYLQHADTALSVVLMGFAIRWVVKHYDALIEQERVDTSACRTEVESMRKQREADLQRFHELAQEQAEDRRTLIAIAEDYRDRLRRDRGERDRP